MRYQAVSQYLAQMHLPYFVEFAYVSRGILVNGQFYPILRMEWVEPPSLHDFIGENRYHPEVLVAAAEEFFAMARRLHRSQIAHGDLQNDSLRVRTSGARPKFVLIDYDTLFVPALEGSETTHVGVPAFQHPKRANVATANAKIDYFAELVIYLTLLAIAEDPRLWDEYRIADRERALIFHGEDFRSGTPTEAFQRLRQLSPLVSKLALLLWNFTCRSDIRQLIPIEEAVRICRTSDVNGSEWLKEWTSKRATIGYQRLPLGTHQPGLIIFLIDQSESMKCPFHGTSKEEIAALVVNRCIYEIINACKQGESIRDRCHIGVIGYGATTDILVGGRPSELAQQVRRAQSLKRSVYDGAGGLVEINFKLPIWLEPRSENGTPLATAFTFCADLIALWISENPDNFPPIVYNVIGSEPYDSEQTAASACRLLSMGTSDGKIVLYNVHLSDSSGPEITLPSTEEALPDEFSRLLFRISSVLPEPMVAGAVNSGLTPSAGARGLFVNATAETLAKVLGLFGSPHLDDRTHRDWVHERIEAAAKSGAEALDLSRIEITNLPESIGESPQLRQLDLSGNQLSSLPESIGRLAHLQQLDLSGNQLIALPESIGRLRQLRLLFVSENDLVHLPEELQQLSNLERLDLHQNKRLALPEEILGPAPDMKASTHHSRPSDILAYYFGKQSDARPLNEVKLVLVGRGTSGKSSIRDRLLFDTFDAGKKETTGIQINRWLLRSGEENIRVNVWDFAGQEITHTTHRFFLTERSIYLLVLDARADTQDRDAEYWLGLISAFGKDSPVLVALNKWDQKPFDVDRFALNDKYPSIRAFVETDCDTRRGINELMTEIKAAVEALPAVHQPFPAVWARLKEWFLGMKENYLSLDGYRKQCARLGEKEPARQEQLARILHALGIILHYGDDLRLRDTTVLNPRWVTESIYKLLRLRERPGTDGILTLDQAFEALPGEEPSMVVYLIDLMRRFELCFPLDEHEKRWLMPELLSRSQPKLGEEWRVLQAVRLRYQYKVLPEGLIPRLITRTYTLSLDQARWRNGVVLSRDGARALIRADAGTNEVNVTIIGEKKAMTIGDTSGRNRLAKLIRNHFLHLHRDLVGVEPKELVEIEGHRGAYKLVKVLELDERKGNATTIDSDAGSLTINNKKELDRISSPEARSGHRRRLKLFLSYSHKDTRLREVFTENLVLLEEDGLIENWHDGKILPSADWDKEIRHEVEEADMVVFLVSTSLLRSKYVRGVEMDCALKRRAHNEAEIVGLSLRLTATGRGGSLHGIRCCRPAQRQSAVGRGMRTRSTRSSRSCASSSRV
jgi:internalin A